MAGQAALIGTKVALNGVVLASGWACHGDVCFRHRGHVAVARAGYVRHGDRGFVNLGCEGTGDRVTDIDIQVSWKVVTATRAECVTVGVVVSADACALGATARIYGLGLVTALALATALVLVSKCWLRPGLPVRLWCRVIRTTIRVGRAVAGIS